MRSHLFLALRRPLVAGVALIVAVNSLVSAQAGVNVDRASYSRSGGTLDLQPGDVFHTWGDTVINAMAFNNHGIDVNVDGNFQVGTTSWCQYKQWGGTLNVGGYLSIGRYNGSSGSMDIYGGTVNSYNRQIIVGEEGTGYLSLSGGSIYSYSGLSLGLNGGWGGVYLNSGNAMVGGIWKGSGYGELIMNGGWITAQRGNWDFISGLNLARIDGGNAYINNNGNSIGINQTISGTGGANFYGSAWTTLRQNNTYSGDTVVNSGVLDFYESGSLYNNGTAAGNIYVQSGAWMNLNRDNTFGNADTGSSSPVSIIVNGGVIGNGATFNNLNNLTLNGGELRANGGAYYGWNAYELNNVTVGGTNASSITANTSINGNNAILLSRAGTTTFNISSTGDARGDLLVSASLTDGNGIVGSLTKTGLGTMVLSASNSYSGLTKVREGTLAVNGSIAGALQVDAGATLKGSGSIAGAATISGTHGPGNSPGIQSFGSSLSYKNASTVLLEFTQNSTAGRGVSFDGIDVAGDLSFDPGAVMSLTFNGAGSSVNWNDQLWNNYVKTSDGWLLYSVGGNISGLNNLSISGSFLDSNGLALSSARPDSYFNLYQVGNNVYLNYAIPEPSTYALMGLGAVALVIAVRRRKA